MKITDGKSDALELIVDIKAEMEKVRRLIAELEFLVYEKDERVEIILFERGKHDEERSKE